ncbi:15057_t:CDS:2, partial [Gigaspora rosea]
YLQKQLSESTSIKNINQRREDYDDATSTNYKNTNITSQVSLSDNESDNSSVVSSPIYENNETTSPQSVSFAHENNEATSSHPVSSVYETDVSLPQEMISLYQLIEVPAQFQQVDNEFEIALWLARHKRILDLATNIRNGMMTRLDEGDEEHVTTSVSSILHEPTLKLPEIDQLTNEFRALNERFVVYDDKFRGCEEEPYDELNEFVTNNVWKQLLQMHLKATDQTKLKKDSEIFTQLKNFVHQVIKAVLIAKDNHKDTQNAIRKCDEYTIDLEIPTKFGIVKSLPVRELLNC